MTGKAIGTHIRLEDLSNDFDAVYLAIGSWRPNPLLSKARTLGGFGSESVFWSISLRAKTPIWERKWP
jgi:hypothetical protein